MAKQVKSDIETFARIKVIGVGGSGNNAINHMIKSKVKGVDFIAVNTDAQALHKSLAPHKIHIGKMITRGLGTGMNAELGKKAAEESQEEIQEVLKNADMVFITGGMGGGTGTGAAPVVASIAKQMGILTIGVVTKPFSFEGKKRAELAEIGISNLQSQVDALVTIPNDKIFTVIDEKTNIKSAFAICDDILKQAVEGISELITTPGIINVDFADIKAVMENAGSALMGIGKATGDDRATKAAELAINSPLLDISIDGATGVLFAVSGGNDLTMMEIQEAANLITQHVDPEAKVIFGAIEDPTLKKGEIKITVIATGFDKSSFQDNPSKESFDKKSIFFGSNKASEDEKEDLTQEEDKKEIHNEVIKPSDTRRDDEELKTNSEDEEDDWSAIPSFLRRRK